LEDFNADKSEVSLLEGVQISTAVKQLDKALAWLQRWQCESSRALLNTFLY
jgi:hypothetical protein